MKTLVTYIQSTHELNQFLELKNSDLSYELIFGCSELSRYSKTSFEDLLVLINLAVKNKLERT